MSSSEPQLDLNAFAEKIEATSDISVSYFIQMRSACKTPTTEEELDNTILAARMNYSRNGRAGNVRVIDMSTINVTLSRLRVSGAGVDDFV